MANVKITELTALTNPASTDVLPIVDVVADVTKKVTIADLLENAGAGSASAPAFAFDGDSDTGMYRSAANSLAFTTGGTGRLFIDSSGRIGIGGNGVGSGLGVYLQRTGNYNFYEASDGTKTMIAGVDSALDYVKIGSLSNHNLGFITDNTEQMRIDSLGRIGIGGNGVGSGLGVYLQRAGNSNFYEASDGTKTMIAGVDSALDFVKIGSLSNHNLGFITDNTERMRIDSSGRLLVGTSSSLLADSQLQVEGTGYYEGGASLRRNSNDAGGTALRICKSRGTSNGSFSIVSSGDTLGLVQFCGADGNSDETGAEIRAEVDGTPSDGDMPGRLVFSTTADGAASPTERMRITSLGALKVSNTGSYLNANAAPHEIRNNADNNNVLIISSAASNGAQYGLSIRTADDQNDTTRDFLECLGGTVVRAKIRSNGGLANYQANDVNLSDRNAKKDISPVTGTWNCIKEWEIVNYRYKDQPDDADLNLGVIAQQVAESCPEVITVFEEAKDDQPEKLGVKEQQMYWMAIKALQEAQSRIETLEAKVAALEAG